MEWTRKDIAAAFGVSAGAVDLWKKEAAFPAATRQGRAFVYQASDVVHWFVRREVNRIVGLSNVSQDPGAAPADMLNLQQERARLARAQAETKELELAEKRGDVVGASVARQALAHAIGAARHVLLMVHAEIASTHPGLPVDVIESIRKMHHDALTALSEARMPGRSSEVDSDALEETDEEVTA